MALVIVLLEVVRATVYHLPDPSLPLLTAVVYAAFRGGSPAGFLASLMGLGYLVDSLSPGSRLALTASEGESVKIATFTVCAAVITALVGALQHRSERRYAREQEHSKRMATLEQVKGQFLNLASHELRGPLGVARGYVSMLGDGSFGPLEAADVRRAVPVLSAKLREMNALVDSMLDTARLEEHRLTLKLSRCDLRDIVDGAVDAVAPTISPRHELRWAPPARPVTVMGDPARLSIVVTNLLDNAVKYSPGGGVVQCLLSSDGEQALLTVWDHGLGIAEQDLARLFTRFGRIVTPENSHIRGTGLGLYLARELARLHGGDLCARSAPGAGSSFTLVLPLAPFTAADVRATETSAARKRRRDATAGRPAATPAGPVAAPRRPGGAPALPHR